jgi:hypothetical protein
MAKKSLYSPHPSLSMESAFLAKVAERTGRTLEEWVALIRKDGPAGDKERRAWLKSVHGLKMMDQWFIVERAAGDGFGAENYDPEKYVAEMFASKPLLVAPYERLLKASLALGNDVKACPCKTIVPLYRQHVFAELKPASRTRLEFNLALGAEPFTERLLDSGGTAKGDRLTHRINISTVADIDAEVLARLAQAYEHGADTLPRRKAEAAPPADLLEAVAKAGLRKAWDALPPSHRREHVSAVVGAKKPETRARRIEKAVAMLRTRKAAAS